jgi:hypothetical protein
MCQISLSWVHASYLSHRLDLLLKIKFVVFRILMNFFFALKVPGTRNVTKKTPNFRLSCAQIFAETEFFAKSFAKWIIFAKFVENLIDSPLAKSEKIRFRFKPSKIRVCIIR